MRRRFSRTARLLIALGIAAQLAATLALARVDAALEYAVPAPDVRQTEARDDQPARAETGIENLLEGRDDVEEQLGDALAAISASGIKTGAEASYGGRTEKAALRAVDLRWLETCPRQLASGRWMDASELARGARVAVLDENVAFALFGSEEAAGRELEIEGEKYRVIGVARHRRSVGEADSGSVYLPLRAAGRQGVQLDAMILCALGASPAGLSQSFAEAAQGAWGAGELHDLQKERMGALLLTRLTLCAFGLALAFRLGRGYRRLVGRWRKQVAARRKRAYARRWLGPALLRALGAALLGALLLGGVYGILSFGIAPVYRFTEWVPESLVSASAIRKVFWSRAAEAARTISIRTPESARIAFWGALDRVGATALLLGLALGRRNVRKDQS